MSNRTTLTNSSQSSIGERQDHRQASVVVRAHEGVVDRGRLIKPMTREAVRRLPADRPAVRMKSELVVPHRHDVTSRAFRLDGRARGCLGGRRNRRGEASDESHAREENCARFHPVDPGLEHRLAQRYLGQRRKQDDLGARILGSEDEDFGLKAGDVALRHVDDAGDQPADEL
jgi:hypothetical protein